MQTGHGVGVRLFKIDSPLPSIRRKGKKRDPLKPCGVNFIASEGAFHSLHNQRLDGLPWLLNQ